MLFLLWRWSQPLAVAVAVATSTQPSPTMATLWADLEVAWTAPASSHGKILFSAHHSDPRTGASDVVVSIRDRRTTPLGPRRGCRGHWVLIPHAARSQHNGPQRAGVGRVNMQGVPSGKVEKKRKRRRKRRLRREQQQETGQPVSGQYKSTRMPRGWLLATAACSCQIMSSWRGGEAMVLNRVY
ncbi:hypothetical protein QBC36DRAFT_364872 [Triangularia setosa]|uniref:Secreted protein n=1 Tax=Triangularia setosa TaxID=2587417 RepID=A0AAN6WEM1_9PEZI|nr:hypothetical protein QBC36DRAFT_364872 [Podospora setosa]